MSSDEELDICVLLFFIFCAVFMCAACVGIIEVILAVS